MLKIDVFQTSYFGKSVNSCEDCACGEMTVRMTEEKAIEYIDLGIGMNEERMAFQNSAFETTKSITPFVSTIVFE